jgi:hypothetical protein
MESIGVEALWPPNDSGFEAHAAAGGKPTVLGKCLKTVVLAGFL